MSAGRNDVIIVNEQDEWMGTMEKQAAHEQGVLHRAISIFVTNERNELLIQQRAEDKYHSGGLWSNTCCSHPIPHESTLAAAHRRLQEEMGFDCGLHHIFNMMYKAKVGNELTEHEYDHVYAGMFSGTVLPNSDEVKSYQFISLRALTEWMEKEPHAFTPWMHMAFPRFVQMLNGESSYLL